jgi:hypothetical protein
MKTVFMIPLLGMVLMFSCQQPGEDKKTDQAVTEVEPPLLEISPSMESYISTVAAYFDASIAVDSVKIQSLITEDYVEVQMFAKADSNTVADLVAAWRAYGEARSDQSVEQVAASALQVNDGEFKGDWIQFWGNYKCTDNASGEKIVLPFFTNTKIENGKMKVTYLYYDRLGFMETVGFTVSPPAGT